ncbi:hypothetical protein JX266_009885 [Neoarthrinium moseri]|nr:hypothetical protein JX266_009885 [Neoarthrinium moseri]
MDLVSLRDDRLGSQDSLGSLVTIPTSFLETTTYTDWYTGRSNEGSDPAKQAYEDAVKILKNELSITELSLVGLSGHNFIRDVQQALLQAMKGYEAKSKETKLCRWLMRCSAGIMYYAGVFDTLSQHYPEYVSLAWGAFKFLFIAVMNYEELLVEISKAVTKVADVLPRAELHSLLYPTASMQEAVALVYAKIMEFVVMAIRWYNKGKFKHSISVIIAPFKLNFKPIIEEITERSKRVDELANAASKAEIRDLHITIRGLKTDMQELKQIFIANSALQNQVVFDMREQKQFFRAAQLEDIRKRVLVEDTPDYESNLEDCQIMRNHRRQRLISQVPSSEITKLKSWLEDPSSPLLLAKSRGVKTSSLDFAIDFLGAVREQGYPIIWALPSRDQENVSSTSLPAIIRSLILQVVALSSETLSNGLGVLNAQKFKEASSVHTCSLLLQQCLVAISAVMIIIDLGVLISDCSLGSSRSSLCEAEELVELLVKISRQRDRRGLKIIVTSWNSELNPVLSTEDTMGYHEVITDRGRKVEKMMRRPKFRGLHRQREKRVVAEFKSSVASL